ncbi:MAG: efflux RND transporter periplasmic adaptor subunit [Campylobacterota bacterium]
MIKKLVLFLSCVVVAFANENAALVTVAPLEKEEVSSVESFTGSVRFAKKSGISIEGSGQVKAVHFSTGDSVAKGEVLLELDTQTLQAKISSAKAALNAAKVEYARTKRDFSRYEKLLKNDSIAQKTYDDSSYAMQTAAAKMQQAQALLQELQVLEQKAILKAPFDAVVVAKETEVGQWIASGNVVAQLVDTNSVELIYNLPAHYSDTIEVGSEYEVTINSRSYFATLDAKLPTGDAITRTFSVKLIAQIEDFVFDGMEARAKFPSQKSKESFVVSRDAVINRFGGNVIIVAKDNKAEVIEVKVVGYAGDYLAIAAEGLQEGMQVITKGNERVFPDQTLQIINR